MNNAPNAAALSVIETLVAEDKDAVATAAPVTSRDVEKHLGLVNQVVSRFMKKLPANVERGDLVAAGMYGLVTSLERNGGDAGDTFEGYARMRIRGAILDELRAQDWLSRRARWAAGGEAYEGPRALVGFEDVGEGEREKSFADGETPDALSVLEAIGTRQEIEHALAQLPEREHGIIARHYFEGVPFKTLAAELGVSEPRVSQIHTRALGRLRGLLATVVAA